MPNFSPIFWLRLKRQAALAAALGLCATANAQYVGPSNTPAYRNVAEILKNPVDDAPVTLTGHLVRQISKKKYLFNDGSGEIRVEIDNHRFPATPIDDKTRLRIVGEVEKDFMESPEIDVERVEIVR